MSDTFWGLSATQWTAYYTLLTAGLLLVAIAAALYARNQVQVARAAQRETSRPYVILTAESSPIGWRVMDLVVRNIGQRPAYNVRMLLIPEPQRANETPGAPIREVRWLKEAIPMLAPGQELRTYYDSMDERLNSGREDLPMSHDYTVEYDERASPLKKGKSDHRDKGVVDINAMGGAMQPDVYNIHHVASALREIKKEIAKHNRAGNRARTVGNTEGRSPYEVRDILAERGPRPPAEAPEPVQADSPESTVQRLYARFRRRGKDAAD